MPLKVVISLPNDVSITLESSEAQLYDLVIGMVLKELPKELAQLSLSASISDDKGEKSSSAQVLHLAEESKEAAGPTEIDSSRGERSERAFQEFCSTLSPLGDMRRVVVAAEGARRFLEMHQVSPGELEGLFQLAGWPKPKDLVQSLRNAARSSFRWLERVPGRQGYYTVSDRGCQEVVGNR